jgi:hypothetical protein
VIVLYVLLALVLLVNCFIAWRLSRRDRSSSLVKRTLIVHTKDDQSLKGVLRYEHGHRYTLANAVYIRPDGREQPVDGLIHILTSNLAFCQEVSE